MKFTCSCLLFILVASETITKNSEDPSPSSIAGSTKIEETTRQNEKFGTTTVLREEIDKTAVPKPDVLVKSDQIPVETIEKIQIKAYVFKLFCSRTYSFGNSEQEI